MRRARDFRWGSEACLFGRREFFDWGEDDDKKLALD